MSSPGAGGDEAESPSRQSAGGVPKRRRIAADAEDNDNDNENKNDEPEEEMLDRSEIPFAPAGPAPQRMRRIRGDIYGDDNDGVDNDGAANDNDNLSDAGLNPVVGDEEDGDNVDGDVHMGGDDDYMEEEEDGEDLMDNAMRDYQRIDALDTYGTEGIDDRDFSKMDREERLAAERELDRRSGAGRDGDAYYDDFETEEDDEARAARRRHIGRRRKEDRDEDDEDGSIMEEEEDDEDEDVEEVNMEAFDVPLREWIAQDRTRREIQRRFRKFLSTFREPSAADAAGGRHLKGPVVYEQRIKKMAANNGQTLEVSYLHLTEMEPTIALWLADAPNDILDILNETATRYTLRLFPSYGAIRDEVIVRFSEYPILDSLRNLRRSHLDTLVKITGVVTRRSAIFPQIKLAYYDCLTCNNTLGPFRVDSSTNGNQDGGDDGGGGYGGGSGMNSPQMCGNCQQMGPFKLNPSKTQYRNYQRVTIQETPGTVPPGRVPRSKIAIFSNDLCDRARPGEEIEVSGIYNFFHNYVMSQRTGFQVFDTQVHANHVVRREDLTSSMSLTEADKAKILELARDPNIGDRIIRSMAPSIYGHKHVKTAIAMSLFSGVPKNIHDKHRIRGDINVLLLGDPGTAKSQVLKYAEKTAPRSVYSTGKGASAVGLTASVHKDPVTREWTLEGGALVLADRGLCLIDEFDKMNEQDRTSIHEAMEQQVSKPDGSTQPRLSWMCFYFGLDLTRLDYIFCLLIQFHACSPFRYPRLAL
jgi:DNA replication licensing factor MCM2